MRKMKHQPVKEWLALILTLPTGRPSQRMRTWRSLKGLGAAALRDGVYLLPADAAARAAFDAEATAVRGCGGEARILLARPENEAQEAALRSLFNRDARYAAVDKQIKSLRLPRGPRGADATERKLRKLRKEFELVRAMDYFPSDAGKAVERRLLDVKRELEAVRSQGEPRNQSLPVGCFDPAEFHGRVWATRANVWVDRLASAWLIRRFIDPKARFIWLKPPYRCPKNAVGYDFDGAMFSHVGSNVTFEALVHGFSLDADTALVRVGTLIHDLDVGPSRAAEAYGLETILEGLRISEVGDDAFSAAAAKLFDALYARYRQLTETP